MMIEFEKPEQFWNEDADAEHIIDAYVKDDELRKKIRKNAAALIDDCMAYFRPEKAQSHNHQRSEKEYHDVDLEKAELQRFNVQVLSENAMLLDKIQKLEDAIKKLDGDNVRLLSANAVLRAIIGGQQTYTETTGGTKQP